MNKYLFAIFLLIFGISFFVQSKLSRKEKEIVKEVTVKTISRQAHERKGTKVEYPVFNEPDFISYPKRANHINDDSFYADIINHDDDPFLSNTRSTNAHETTHGINSDIRNSRQGKVNAFYVGNNRAIVVDEPNFTIGDVVSYIPIDLRGYRFDLYLVQQRRDWDDRPLYIFDEWIAYVNGGKVNVEDAEKGMNKEWTDAVMGCLEFSIYSTAVAMAAKDKAPDYWNNNVEFRNYVYWCLNESRSLFQKGKDKFPWDKQDALLANLKNDPNASRMREFLKEYFDGIWLDGPTSIEKYGKIDWSGFEGCYKAIEINGKKVGLHEK